MCCSPCISKIFEINRHYFVVVVVVVVVVVHVKMNYFGTLALI